MRKAFSLVLGVALVVGLTAGVASAISLGDQVVEVNLDDWSNLYDSSGNTISTPSAGGGDEGRTIIYINEIKDETGSTSLWDPTSTGEELTAAEYDLWTVDSTVQGYKWDSSSSTYVAMPLTGSYQVAGTTTTVYYVAGDEGGVIKVYYDSSPDFYSAGYKGYEEGPDAWDDSTPGDYDYPNVTDVNPDGPDAGTDYDVDSDVSVWLEGTFVELFDDQDKDKFRDVGEETLVYFDIDGDGLDLDEVGGSDDVAAVYTTIFSDVIDALSGWIDITGGTYYDAGGLDDDYYDNSGHASDYDITLIGTLSVGGSDAGGWSLTSDDPARFHSLPEPTSLLLMALGLVGIGARLRRKKK